MSNRRARPLLQPAILLPRLSASPSTTLDSTPAGRCNRAHALCITLLSSRSGSHTADRSRTCFPTGPTNIDLLGDIFCPRSLIARAAPSCCFADAECAHSSRGLWFAARRASRPAYDHLNCAGPPRSSARCLHFLRVSYSLSSRRPRCLTCCQMLNVLN